MEIKLTYRKTLEILDTIDEQLDNNERNKVNGLRQRIKDISNAITNNFRISTKGYQELLEEWDQATDLLRTIARNHSTWEQLQSITTPDQTFEEYLQIIQLTQRTLTPIIRWEVFDHTEKLRHAQQILRHSTDNQERTKADLQSGRSIEAIEKISELIVSRLE